MILLDEKIDYNLVYEVAHSNKEISISEKLKQRILHSRVVLEEKIRNNRNFRIIGQGSKIIFYPLKFQN